LKTALFHLVGLMCNKLTYSFLSNAACTMSIQRQNNSTITAYQVSFVNSPALYPIIQTILVPQSAALLLFACGSEPSIFLKFIISLKYFSHNEAVEKHGSLKINHKAP